MTEDAFSLMVRQVTGERHVADMGRLERLKLLRAFETAQASGKPIAPEVLQWIGDAVRTLLAHGGCLDEHLGIASKRRGRNQAPHKLLAMDERDAAIAAIYASLAVGTPSSRSEATARIIQGREPITAGPGRHALEVLQRIRSGVALPVSSRQIVRIVHAQASTRRPP